MKISLKWTYCLAIVYYSTISLHRKLPLITLSTCRLRPFTFHPHLLTTPSWWTKNKNYIESNTLAHGDMEFHFECSTREERFHIYDVLFCLLYKHLANKKKPTWFTFQKEDALPFISFVVLRDRVGGASAAADWLSRVKIIVIFHVRWYGVFTRTILTR